MSVALRSKRSVHLRRLQALHAASNPQSRRVAAALDRPARMTDRQTVELGWLAARVAESGSRISTPLLLLLSASVGTLSAAGTIPIFPWYVVPITFLAGLAIPFCWLERKAVARAEQFGADYPSVVLATAASMKAGMNVYAALERSVQLLPSDNLVRTEIVELLQRLRDGVAPEQAVAAFGRTIRQPELRLFRSGFLLVIEHGGRFAPTLERLAKVTRERSLLIQSARVSTTTMRMTANALLLLTPLIVGMIAARTAQFWEIILENELANALASIGVVVIGLSYATLQRMSSFKP